MNKQSNIFYIFFCILYLRYQLKMTLQFLCNPRDIDIMDNMVVMLEKYATNLEDTVAERTKQLIEEKKKTDTLLYQMLPPYGIIILHFYCDRKRQTQGKQT